MKKSFKLLSLLLALLFVFFSLAACTSDDVIDAIDTASDIAQMLGDSSEASSPSPEASSSVASDAESSPKLLDENGSYTSKDEVSLYIHTYGHLPGNFVTKAEAEAAGWTGGSVDRYLPGKSIGGDRFGNREGLLPSAKGRTWTECDINTLGASSRGSERIVFSNDGLIYYTGDHYESFQALY